MCGIAGSLEPDGPVDEDRLRERLALLEHRGPDSSGVFARGRGAVGQTRLAVIDLITGDPPITNEDGTVGAALNGEIYNFAQLRDQLGREGHALRTKGDTEVLVHLAESRSPVEVARALAGMFAFAVWDSRRERLLIGRDRVGKKPLYFWYGGGPLVFASEIKALLADGRVPRELDPGAIPAYLTFGYVPTPRTFYSGLVSIPPAHVLVARPGRPPHLERYWSAPRCRDAPGPQRKPAADRVQGAAAAVRGKLLDAVRRRLVADVPFGAFLSGGVDSSVVVGLASQLVGSPLKTFTIGFEDRDGYDERAHARIVAARWGTDHTEFVVKPDAVDLVQRLVWHHDQPFGDSSAIPTFLLSELTRKQVTVALSGDGGDELFAGYERFAAGLAVDGYGRLPAPARRLARSAAGGLPGALLRGRKPSLERFLAHAGRGLPAAYLGWLSLIQEPLRRQLVDGSLRERDWAIEDYERVWKESEGCVTLDRLLDLNLRTYLVDDLLVKVDRMSMAHGLEVRCPFLDTALIEYVWPLPAKLKLRGLRLKHLLKVAAADVLPAEIVRRPKRGFGVPLDRWFRGELEGYLNATVGARDARIREHLDSGAVDRLLSEHASGRVRHGQALWALLTLEVFLRREGW